MWVFYTLYFTFCFIYLFILSISHASHLPIYCFLYFYLHFYIGISFSVISFKKKKKEEEEEEQEACLLYIHTLEECFGESSSHAVASERVSGPAKRMKHLKLDKATYCASLQVLYDMYRYCT